MLPRAMLVSVAPVSAAFILNILPRISGASVRSSDDLSVAGSLLRLDPFEDLLGRMPRPSTHTATAGLRSRGRSRWSLMA